MHQPEVPLRFHHLARIKQAVQIGSVETANFSLYNAKVALYPENKGEHTMDSELYYFDLIGEFPDDQSDILTAKAELERTGRLRSALDRYLKLPDDTALRLISIGQDWICECAVGGLHCLIADRVNFQFEEEIAIRLGDRKEEMGISGPYFLKRVKGEGMTAITRKKVVMSILDTVPSISYLFCKPDELEEID